MNTTATKTIRSRFIEILLDNPNISSLPENQMRSTMAKILEDLDKDGILDEIDFYGTDEDWLDDLDEMSAIEFDESRTDEEKAMAIEFLQKPKEDRRDENNNILSLASLQRIREKRIELAQDPRSGIVLTAEERGEVGEDSEEEMPNSYGRTPLHEAIAMRNLDAIRKYVSEGRYLETRDNNGNTPYQMAYQEGYTEAAEIFEEFLVAA